MIRQISLIAIAALYIGIITGCKTSTTSSNQAESTSTSNTDDTLAKVRQLLRQAVWQGTGTNDFHACGFDDRMFKYMINDLQRGYVRQKASYTGQYKLERGDDGTIYVSFHRGKVDVMYKLVKTQDGRNELLGDINLIQDMPGLKEEPAPEQELASASPSTENTPTEAPATTSTQTAPVSITGTIAVEKAYFYREPNDETRRKGYLIKDQSVTLGDRKGNFVYCTYVTDESKTEGWMLSIDVKLDK